MRFLFLISLLAPALILGCNARSTINPGITSQPESAKVIAVVDQAQLCQVTEWNHDAVASACRPGQKVVFLPNSFGNEQLPVIFAAVNCDLLYAIALTKGAVTCIYNPIQPVPAQPAASNPSRPTSKP